ncbi:MAG: proteinase inhibitor serpin [Pedosphaera sp.]|nr:proteinase inhibitor serpin [Pedosphaera sp.]
MGIKRKGGMKKIKNGMRVGLALLLGIASAGAAETNAMKSLVAGNTAFALDLYGQLKATEGNLFFSPYSVSTCLAMAHAGARGETEKQMAQVLHFGMSPGEVDSAFGGLQKDLNAIQKKKGVELDVANGLWAQAGHSFLPAFLDVARQQYEGRVSQADFKTKAEPVRREINGWVSKQTKGKIQEIIPAGSLDANTRLVLVNAIYFKGRWTTPFRTNSTAVSPFHVNGNTQVQAPLMNMTAEFNYAEAEGLQVLELPYVGDELSMVVLLPRDPQGLKAVEGRVSPQKLEEWLTAARSQKVKVFLPKFKLEAKFDLNDTLAAMGMRNPFSAQADFSGMDGQRDLYISAVVHKAFVEVNEEGTEAAAATGTTMALTSAMRPAPIPIFRADHPFIFLIREKASGSILFLGRLMNPTK